MCELDRAGESQSDEELLAVARSENEEAANRAFEILVLRYRGRICALARRYFPTLADGEDMAQEAFVRAYQNLSRLRPGVPFRNWLIRITVNLCLDRLRREKRRPEKPLSRIGPDESAWLDRQLHARSGDRQRSDETRQEASAVVEMALEAIPPRDRAVLHLLYFEERSVAEIAEIMGWSQSNVKVRAFRARRRMRNVLKEMMAEGRIRK